MSSELERTVDHIVDDSVSSKLDIFATDLAERLKGECAALVEQFRRTESLSADGSLDRLLSGLKQIQKGRTVVDVAGSLVEAAAEFCGRAGLLINKGNVLLGFRLAGADAETGAAFHALRVNLLEAPSFEQAVDTSGNVVASGSPDELSKPFAELLGLSAEDRVGIFPVLLRSKVLAVLYCDSGGAGAPQPLQSAAIEALISAAEGWIEAVSTRKR